MNKKMYFKFKNDGNLTPIVDLDFYNFLKSNFNPNFVEALNAYLLTVGFDYSLHYMHPDQMGIFGTQFSHFACLNKIELDKKTTYYLVKNRDITDYSTFRASSFCFDVDYSGKLYNEHGDYNLSLDFYTLYYNRKKRADFIRLAPYPEVLKKLSPQIYFVQAFTDSDFSKALDDYHRALYLTPAAKIDRERFWEMLEVLPPENWTRTGDIEHFRMCEYTTGTITTQFAKWGDCYIEKPIDVCDRSTWINHNDFLTINQGL